MKVIKQGAYTKNRAERAFVKKPSFPVSNGRPHVHKHSKSHTVGKWVFKQTKAEILICACGNKYIKTRLNQKLCVRCINGRV